MTQEVRTSLDFKTAFLLGGASGVTGQVPTKQADESIIWATPSAEGIALVVSNKGEVATVGNNYVEKAVDRACTVVGATWELNPTATSTSGSSAAMLFARRSGTKTNLLTANASLPVTTGIFTNVTSTLTGTLTLAAENTIGVDLVSVGTGASGLIFTVYVRYS
jgi:hypothetical protein